MAILLGMKRARFTTAVTMGLLVLLALGKASVLAQSPAERGAAIASKLCARCHAVGRAGESPLGIAPPFRDLSKRYPVENLAEALAEGIVTGHPEMPHFTFTPREIDALLAFLESLSR